MLTYYSFNQLFYYFADLLAFAIIIFTMLVSLFLKDKHNPLLLVLAIQLVNDMIGIF